MKRSFLTVFLFLAAVLPAALPAQDAKLNALQTAVKADPKSSTAHFNLAVEYYNRQQLEAALPEFEAAVKRNSKDKEAKEMLSVTRGILSFRRKDFEAATKDFQNALKINPKSPDAIQYLPHSYMYLKEYDKAEKGYRAYLEAFGNNPEAARVANHNLSKLYIEQGRYPEAETALKGLLAQDPKNFDANKNLGFVRFMRKDYAGAATSLEKALRTKKDAQAYKILGNAYYQLGRFKDATSRYEASLKLDKSDPELYYNLAVAYFDNAQYDEAADAFGQALQLNPKDSNAATFQAQAIETAINSHMEKGSNFYLNNEYSKAIEEWKAVLKYQPDHEAAKAFLSDARGKQKEEVRRHVKAGEEFNRQGKNVEALRELNLALAMDPANKDAHTAITRLKVKRSEKVGSYLEQGDEYMATKDYAAAILKYRSALKVNPEDARAKTKLSRARALQKQEYQAAYAAGKKSLAAKDLKKAIRSFEEARRLDPSKAEAGDLLFQTRSRLRSRVKELLEEGTALYASGDKNKARERFQAVVALERDNETANEYIRKLTGQQSQAKADSEKIRAMYYEGVNLYINGKIHEAILRWKECLKLDPNFPNAQKNIDKAYVKLQSIQKLGQD